MNSAESNLDTVQADDIAGVRSLYNTGPAYQALGNGPILRNLSTRALIGTGQNVLIGGFVVQGSAPATFIVRAIGYSLRAFGITAPITDPKLTIYDANHQVVATNDDWFTSTSGPTIASYHLDPPNSIESALYVTLHQGAYTAVVEGFSPSVTGIGLVELYRSASDREPRRQYLFARPGSHWPECVDCWLRRRRNAKQTGNCARNRAVARDFRHFQSAG